MQVASIKVTMLGSFSVWVNGTLILDKAPKLVKPWQLFCYLVLNRKKFVPTRTLIATLWADDMLTDPANVLKNAVYTLRKELCGGVPAAGSPIIYSAGGYRFNPAVALELDADIFSGLCEQARQADENAPLQIELCSQALVAYTGELLPQLDQDLWAVSLALDYKRRYLDCTAALCEHLWRQERFKELLDASSAVIRLEPLDERITVYQFRAMEALKMHRVIVTAYSRLTRQYKDALGGNPPAEAQRIYAAACEHINKTEQDIIVIKTDLVGTEEAVRSQRGAYYCSYSSLRHMYTLMKRTADRDGKALVLALYTLSPAKSAAARQYDMVRAMAELKVVAMNNLRKTDALARYSRNQYVMLLRVTSLNDGRLVRERIRGCFAGTTALCRMSVDVKLTEV